MQPNFESSWGGGSDAALTVSVLTRHLAALVREDVILQDVWIRGELLNVNRAPSGHLYFSLRDAEATLPCVMFRSAAWRLRFRPENGAQVLAHGAVEVYPQRGQYQLVIDVLRTSGQGAASLSLEAARSRLLEEGLLDPLRKRPLPAFPERVAVVTSLAGAAVHDICVILQRSPFPPDLRIVPALVQGADSIPSLVRALEIAGESSGAQVLLLARGGGAAEDLWSFNSEEVARAICASPIPVISAVGHETDTTLADLAADLRVATPTAGAELLLARRHEVIQRAKRASSRAEELLQARISQGRACWEGLLRRAPLARPGWMVDSRRQRLDDLERRLVSARELHLTRDRGRLSLLAGKLEGLSPLATLARGYAVVTSQRTVVTAADQVGVGDGVQVRLASGTFQAAVTEVDPHGEKR